MVDELAPHIGVPKEMGNLLEQFLASEHLDDAGHHHSSGMYGTASLSEAGGGYPYQRRTVDHTPMPVSAAHIMSQHSRHLKSYNSIYDSSKTSSISSTSAPSWMRHQHQTPPRSTGRAGWSSSGKALTRQDQAYERVREEETAQNPGHPIINAKSIALVDHRRASDPQAQSLPVWDRLNTYSTVYSGRKEQAKHRGQAIEDLKPSPVQDLPPQSSPTIRARALIANLSRTSLSLYERGMQRGARMESRRDAFITQHCPFSPHLDKYSIELAKNKPPIRTRPPLIHRQLSPAAVVLSPEHTFSPRINERSRMLDECADRTVARKFAFAALDRSWDQKLSVTHDGNEGDANNEAPIPNLHPTSASTTPTPSTPTSSRSRPKHTPKSSRTKSPMVSRARRDSVGSAVSRSRSRSRSASRDRSDWLHDEGMARKDRRREAAERSRAEEEKLFTFTPTLIASHPQKKGSSVPSSPRSSVSAAPRIPRSLKGAYMPLSEKQQILDAHIRSPSVEIQGVVCGLESRKGDPSGPSVPWSFPLGKVAKGEGGAFPWPAPTPTTPTAFISIASTPVISDAGSEVDTRRTPPRIRAASLSPRSELRRMVRAAKASQGAIYNHMERHAKGRENKESKERDVKDLVQSVEHWNRESTSSSSFKLSVSNHRIPSPRMPLIARGSPHKSPTPTTPAYFLTGEAPSPRTTTATSPAQNTLAAKAVKDLAFTTTTTTPPRPTPHSRAAPYTAPERTAAPFPPRRTTYSDELGWSLLDLSVCHLDDLDAFEQEIDENTRTALCHTFRPDGGRFASGIKAQKAAAPVDSRTPPSPCLSPVSSVASLTID